MSFWQWIGAYAALAVGCFSVLLLVTPMRPDEPTTTPSQGARIIVIAGALMVMAMIIYELQKRPPPDQQTATNIRHSADRESPRPQQRYFGKTPKRGDA